MKGKLTLTVPSYFGKQLAMDLIFAGQASPEMGGDELAGVVCGDIGAVLYTKQLFVQSVKLSLSYAQAMAMLTMLKRMDMRPYTLHYISQIDPFVSNEHRRRKAQYEQLSAAQ